MRHLVDRAVGDDLSGVQGDRPVGDRPERVEVVRHHHHGEREAVGKRANQPVEGAGADRIEAGRRLVEEEDLGLEREGARERDALAHAARELGGHLAERVGSEPDQRQLEADKRVHEAGVEGRLLAKRHRDVVGDGDRREQGAILEQHPEAPPQRREPLLVVLRQVLAEQPHASGGRSLQAHHLAQQHRLAGAASTDERHDLPGIDLEAHAVVHDGVAEARDDLLQANEGWCHQIPRRWSTTANAASSRMTQTMLCTTVDVVCSPTLRASRDTDSPMRQATLPMKSPKTGALPSPTITFVESSTEWSRSRRSSRDAELCGGDGCSADDARQVADIDEQRQAEHDRGEAWNDQHLDR